MKSFADEGFNEFSKMLEEFSKKADEEKVLDVIEIGAKAFVDDLLKLPKPRSDISKSGYTHLIDSFAYKREKGEIVVGWGTYYGPMVEHGTRRMKAQPHFRSLYNQNKEKYQKLMISKLF